MSKKEEKDSFTYMGLKFVKLPEKKVKLKVVKDKKIRVLTSPFEAWREK